MVGVGVIVGYAGIYAGDEPIEYGAYMGLYSGELFHVLLVHVYSGEPKDNSDKSGV
jgi:hypothetical protein